MGYENKLVGSGIPASAIITLMRREGSMSSRIATTAQAHIAILPLMASAVRSHDFIDLLLTNDGLSSNILLFSS